MPSEKFDYAALLNDLEAKKTALEASIATLKSAMALGVLGQTPEGVDLSAVAAPSTSGAAESAMPLELPHHAFLGVSMPQAIKTYLEVVKKKQTIKEIAAALREHGMESTSDNFEGVVTGALNRLKAAKEVLRFKDGWGLSAWYPASLRTQINTAAKPSRKNGKKRSKRKKPNVEASSKVAAPNPAAEPVTTQPAATLGSQEQIFQLLRNKPNREFSPEEVISELGMRPQTVHFVLGKLAKVLKSIEKTPAGKYRIANSNVREMTAAV